MHCPCLNTDTIIWQFLPFSIILFSYFFHKCIIVLITVFHKQMFFFSNCVCCDLVFSSYHFFWSNKKEGKEGEKALIIYIISRWRLEVGCSHWNQVAHLNRHSQHKMTVFVANFFVLSILFNHTQAGFVICFVTSGQVNQGHKFWYK